MVKYKVEFELPDLGTQDEVFIDTQIKTLVESLRGILNVYRKAGHKTPTVSFRGLPKESTSPLTEAYKIYSKVLLEHHLKYMPNDTNVGAQRSAIKSLFAMDIPAEKLIEIYDDSKKTYPMTTWLTVKYKINSDPDIVSVVDKEAVLNRWKT